MSKKELIKKEEAEVLNQDDIVVLRLLRTEQLTYRQIALKAFKAQDVFTVGHVYSVVGRLRKKLNLPFYPFNGPNSMVKLPRSTGDAKNVVRYVGKRTLGGLKSYIRTLKYVDKNIAGSSRLVDESVKQLEDEIIIK